MNEITGTKRFNTFEEWRSDFNIRFKEELIKMYERLLYILNEKFAEAKFEIDVAAMVKDMTMNYNEYSIDGDFGDVIDLIVTFNDGWGLECIKSTEEDLHRKKLPKYYQSKTFLTFKKK